MKRELVCINCPMGCRLTVSNENGELIVSGNTCRRGEVYARDEVTDPKRTVTALVAVEGKTAPLPVKTVLPVPKAKVIECAAVLRRTTVKAPVKIGEVVVKDICGTGVSVVATANVL